MTLSDQSHSSILYLLLLTNDWHTFVQTLSWWSLNVISTMCSTNCITTTGTPKFESTVSAAIFTFSTRPSLLCSEPTLFKPGVWNFFAQIEIVEWMNVDILKTIVDSNNPHWFSCCSSLSISLATNVIQKLSKINLSHSSWLFNWLRNLSITCSTTSNIASLDINSIALVFWKHLVEIATRLTLWQQFWCTRHEIYHFRAWGFEGLQFNTALNGWELFIPAHGSSTICLIALFLINSFPCCWICSLTFLGF